MKLLESNITKFVLIIIYFVLPIVSLHLNFPTSNIIINNKISSIISFILILIFYKKQLSMNKLILGLYLYYFIFLILATSGIFS